MGSLAGLLGFDAADRLGGGPPDGAGVLAEVDGHGLGSDVDGDDPAGVDPDCLLRGGRVTRDLAAVPDGRLRLGVDPARPVAGI